MAICCECALLPPDKYVPMPTVESEYSSRFRYPPYQTAAAPIRHKENLTVGEPLEAKPSNPPLWSHRNHDTAASQSFHKRSSYRDAYVNHSMPPAQKTSMVSDWKEPLGKSGSFVKKSVYEEDYRWPTRTTQNSARNEKKQTTSRFIFSTRKEDFYKKSLGKSNQPHCHMPEQKKTIEKTTYTTGMWPHLEQKKTIENTTYTTDFQVPPSTTKRDEPATKAIIPKSNLSFSGEIETHSSYMRDYSKPWHKENYLQNKNMRLNSKEKVRTNPIVHCHCYLKTTDYT